MRYILPAQWSGVSLERFMLEQDGESSLRFREVPRVRKGEWMFRQRKIAVTHTIYKQRPLITG